MEKLDRLGWAEGLCITSYGVRVGLRADRPGVLPELAEYLPPGWMPASSPVVDHLYSIRMGSDGTRPGVRRYHLLYGGILRLCRSLDAGEIYETLETHVQLGVAEQAPRRVFVHAGVVAWRGRAVVIPGRTHTGKSALVAALLRAGATYYSDEYAVLDEKGRVHPYPRRISLRSGEGGAPTRVDAESLGARTGRRSLPVGLVVVTRYREGARWRPRALPAARAALALLDNTVCARTRPEAALSVLQRVVTNARALSGARGEAAEVASWVLAHAGEAW